MGWKLGAVRVIGMRMLRHAAAAALLAASLALAACVPPGVACTTIGYVYTAPVAIEASPSLVGDGTLSACFGEACAPALVESIAPGKWEVPQEPPYAPENTIGIDPGDGIRIAITDSSGFTIRDEWLEIPYTGDSESVCPGPVEFQPVVVEALG